jgi:hypothetical protein
MPNCCLGFSHSGNPCKLKVKDDYFCHNHLYQRPIEHYTPPNDNWPFRYEIMYGVRKYKNPELLLRDTYGRLLKTKFSRKRVRVTSFLFAVETLKLNNQICYNHPVIQHLSKLMVKNFDCIPELRTYIIDFKKKCLKSYRDQARKSLTAFYFKHIEGLCPDVIELIISFI